MIVEVKLFAIARQWVGQESAAVELTDGATVGDLRSALATKYPALAPHMRLMMIAVDTDYAADNTLLRTDAEVALIPPVSGG